MNKFISNEELKQKAKVLVAQMTLEEKAGLCSGKDFWHTKPVERLGLPSILMTDGPHGLRKVAGSLDNPGLGDSVPAVCFPTASALACSFDRDLAYEVGQALGEECLKEGVSVILGPGVNQKRSPLCGRNFEYFSEDPVVSGEMAASMIQGVQHQGVGTSLKHFAANNQEKRRMTVSAVVDERALREVYLKSFEIAVKKGKPWTVMCAYNRLNGTYCSENSDLLTRILREEWGFEGLVMSDWGAVNHRVNGVKAGLDLEMPSSNGINDKKIVYAVKEGYLTEQELDKAACRVAELALRGMHQRWEGYHYDTEKHHQLAVRVAQESAVLLKNEDSILPGKIDQRTAVIGAMAKTPRYQGAGSSKIHPIRVDNVLEAFQDLGVNYDFAMGYELKKEKGLKVNSKKYKLQEKRENELIKEACNKSKDKNIVYIFAGLPEGYESEGFDRTTMSLPEVQNRLIEEVVKINPNVVVILMGGAPMELPWADQVKAILLTYLGGEGSGTAAANLLLGKVVPCGKLAETWPISLKDTPAYHYFPGGRVTVEYRESIYVGYRYYETADKPVRFPFGHGLSYTTFQYSNLKLEKDHCEYGEKVKITVDVTNTGNVAAKESVLLFISRKNARVFVPAKELKEFQKVMLEPGECRQVSMDLDTKELAYYNTSTHDWYAPDGEYQILVGSSVSKIDLQASLRLHSPEQSEPDLREIASSYYHLTKEAFVIPEKEFAALYGDTLPQSDIAASKPYNDGNTLADVDHTLIGKMIIKAAASAATKVTGGTAEDEEMISASLKEMPFHSIVTSGGGALSPARMDGIIAMLNGHYLKGIIKLIRDK